MDIVERARLPALVAATLDEVAGCWRPSMDVYRRACGWTCKLDLAGVAREDLEVYAVGRRLVVRGSRRDRCLAGGHEVHSLEIAYHAFERTVELPCDLASCRIRCTMDNGMLLISIDEASR